MTPEPVSRPEDIIREALERLSVDDLTMTCPNCVTPWKCNGPHQDASGALDSLVEERDSWERVATVDQVAAINALVKQRDVRDYSLRMTEKALTETRAERDRLQEALRRVLRGEPGSLAVARTVLEALSVQPQEERVR